jgi:hypothetical protein
MDPGNELSVWFNVIGNFGFPIVITLYLLLRFEKKIENLEGAIQNLNEIIKNGGR